MLPKVPDKAVHTRTNTLALGWVTIGGKPSTLAIFLYEKY